MSNPIAGWNDHIAEMKAMRSQGETLAAIGARFGLSAERVRHILAKPWVFFTLIKMR